MLTGTHVQPVVYPANDTNRQDWTSLPFGDKLWRLVKRNQFNFAVHNRQVYEAVGGLYPQVGVELDPRRSSPQGTECLKAYGGFVGEAVGVCAELNYNPLGDLGHAALYHDIGKWLVYERHPVIGWHIVSDLDRKERSELLTRAFGDDNERFRTFRLLIRDHDKFGVLSTGESSLLILLPVASYSTHQPSQALQSRLRLALLMVLNLADIAATPRAQPIPGRISLKAQQVKTLCDDWADFDQAIKETRGQREKLAESVLEISQAPSYTVERIHRLLMSSASQHPRLQGDLSNRDLIEEALEDAFGVRVSDFCQQFAAVAKLDYSLSFFADLMRYCAHKEDGGQQRWRQMDPSIIVATVVAILKRVTETYSGLLMTDSRYQAIGVGFEALRTREGQEVKKRIIDLLFKRRERGLAWLMNELSGWQVVA